MSAAYCNLDDKASGLARRPVNNPFIFHEKHPWGSKPNIAETIFTFLAYLSQGTHVSATMTSYVKNRIPLLFLNYSQLDTIAGISTYFYFDDLFL